MTGFILILAIIILGGAIATVGDRIGSRVGKARLSLFNLRPRKTAVLVTILTGSIISASTLGILFATSKQLRDAVFRIESIQKRRRTAEAELRKALSQKDKTEAELAAARSELSNARTRLNQVNLSLKKAIARQKETQNQLNQILARYLQAQKALKQFSSQANALRSQIKRLSAEAVQLQRDRQRLIAQRNQTQTRLEQAEVQTQELEDSVALARTRLEQVESQKNRLESAVAQAQEQLQQAEAEQKQLAQAAAAAQAQLKTADAQRTELLKQQAELTSEIASLEASRKRLEKNVEVLLLGLRRGNITVRTGQVLASGVVQNIKTQASALQVMEQLLREARKTAIVLTNPTQIKPDERVIQITNDAVQQVVQQISDGKSYVIRILSAANYLEGEELVLVVPQVSRNQVIFENGQEIATVSLNPETMTDEQILERLDLLFTTANQRAIQAGILPDPLSGTVGSFRQIDLIKFVLKLKEYQGNITVSAIAPQQVYTAGPLHLELVATQNQRVILRSS